MPMNILTAADLLPVIDITPLFNRDDQQGRGDVAQKIKTACRSFGFFYITGHGVTASMLENLDCASRQFFALPEEIKMEISMDRGGSAWRGFFPVGGELTSGRPDIKEGIYFGSELKSDHPSVVAGVPLHGANLWPRQVPDLKSAVDQYMAATVNAAHHLLEGIALALDLDPDYFERTYTTDPTVLFRIFHYPAEHALREEESWGVGEHTDYGLLTLLAQDQYGGLQVKTPKGWITAPPVEGALVCNIGDMLDRLTGGWFRSTPHRVRNTGNHDRLSFPLFFDPGFSAVMKPLPNAIGSSETTPNERWDNADLQAFDGTYGDYLLGKVAKVFPELSKDVL
jgi:isopenicillin N synthase-like dioxygenase